MIFIVVKLTLSVHNVIIHALHVATQTITIVQRVQVPIYEQLVQTHVHVMITTMMMVPPIYVGPATILA